MSSNEKKSAEARPEAIALDQWRGMALLFVVVAHALHETKKMDGLGRIGVNLFFFISGILVFRSLSGSREGTPGAVARNFWRRRLWRLYPALLAYVAVMVPAQYWLQNIGGIPYGSDFANVLRTTPEALFYLINYVVTPPPSLGHLWSLACEMQFYLLAPLIFLLPGTGAKPRAVVYGTLLAVLLGLGLAEPLLLHDPLSAAKYHFEYSVWPMMAGFFCEYQRGRLLRLQEGMVRAVYRVAVAVCVLGAPLMFLGPKMKMPVIALGALLLLPCLLAYARGWPMPSVAGRWLRWLGERTYSIYLWQQPLTICAFLPVAWWPAGAAGSIVLGALWFHWFERPFLSASRKKIII